MKAYEIRFLGEALDDLEEIVLYIARDSTTAAMLMHDKIIASANDLAMFPKRGRPVPDKKISAMGFRMLGIPPYIAFYRVVGGEVLIYRVLHGATNYPQLYEKMGQG